jgi:predicted nucleotidyltransferase
MGEQDRALIEEFRRRLPSDIASHIKDMILYGSRAWGDADADSDLDLVLCVKEFQNCDEVRRYLYEPEVGGFDYDCGEKCILKITG